MLEWEIDRRRQQEHDTDRISKSLLVFGIVRAGGIERPPVVALLNLSRDLVTVGISAVTHQVPGSQPPRIEVRHIAAGPVVNSSNAHRLGVQDALRLEPCDRRDHTSQTET